MINCIPCGCLISFSFQEQEKLCFDCKYNNLNSTTMNTQTDNSNIVVPENLKDAALNYFRNEYSYLDTPSWSFTLGAQWQKEQYAALVQSHAELLEVVKYFCDCRTSAWRGKLFDAYHKGKDAIQNAEKINIQ